MAERPDEALLEEAGRGSVDAFAELARRHQQRVFRLVYGMTRNPSDADDLTQEAFLTAFKSLSGFNRKSGFYTWIYRIAVNLTLNFLKKRGREKDRTEFDEGLRPADCGPAEAGAPEAASIREELDGRIREAVDALPDHFRASFLMVVDQGMSHAEAAAVLGCSENTVSWRMHKARKMLQARLKPYLSEAAS
jgi:RNA polymerase sigma-70 factor (ECF subfamily)